MIIGCFKSHENGNSNLNNEIVYRVSLFLQYYILYLKFIFLSTSGC